MTSLLRRDTNTKSVVKRNPVYNPHCARAGKPSLDIPESHLLSLILISKWQRPSWTILLIFKNLYK